MEYTELGGTYVLGEISDVDLDPDSFWLVDPDPDVSNEWKSRVQSTKFFLSFFRRKVYFSSLNLKKVPNLEGFGIDLKIKSFFF